MEEAYSVIGTREKANAILNFPVRNYYPFFDSEVPARRSHGGEAAEAFHLVIPSPPGFGFSGPNVLLGWRSRGEREQLLPQ